LKKLKHFKDKILVTAELSSAAPSNVASVMANFRVDLNTINANDSQGFSSSEAGKVQFRFIRLFSTRNATKSVALAVTVIEVFLSIVGG
jgi:hypothetical protein